MTERKPTAAEHEALGARVSALSAASLRISASLDLETVLNEVVGSARALTGARFGAIATIDEAGAPRDFVTSGFTEAEHRRIAEWPDGPRLFEHFRDLPGPVRIVETLRMPGHTAEDLLGILTCRFADGREIALDRLPLASALSRAETVRAEEIVLTTPDGRSVTTLVNATPIDAGDGTLASVVVTMQDLAPLQELERMRAQFLGMVSHELRVPLTSIKGSSATPSRSTSRPTCRPCWPTARASCRC